MAQRREPTPEEVQVRVHGPASLPTVVYLPGLHGNWTLVGAFREQVVGRVRFVELTYPPTLTWTLEDYARSVENALAGQGVQSGWLLAESFSSQVAWPIIAANRFKVTGLILAGGFVRHPFHWEVRMAERICGDISFRLLVYILFAYAKVARWRFRHSPETMRGIEEFIAHLTELERQAAKHRLHLIGQNDPCEIAKQIQVPIYALAGLFDPVVPWYWVRRWLRKNCKALREYKIVCSADHNVLGTGAKAAAAHVLRWINASS